MNGFPPLRAAYGVPPRRFREMSYISASQSSLSIGNAQMFLEDRVNRNLGMDKQCGDQRRSGYLPRSTHRTAEEDDRHA